VDAMSLEDLGNFGEFIAALGVVGSFIFLAFQIRNNTKSINAASYQEANAAFQNVALLPVIHAEIRHLLLVADTDHKSLTKEERYGLYSYYQGVFACYQTIFKGYQNGTVDLELWEGCMVALRNMLRLEPVEMWWSTLNPTFAAGFIVQVNDLRKEIST
jgi:hypothetical protein